MGKANAKGREHLVQQDNGASGTFGLRVGDWKLHHYKKKKARNVVVRQALTNIEVPVYQLFNLADDPAEKKNIIDQHPEVANRLKAQLEQLMTDGRSRS